MWTRKELKEKAKKALNKNYWKAVIAGVLLLLATGSLGMSSGYTFSDTGYSDSDTYYEEEFVFEEDGTVSGESIGEYFIDTVSDPEFIMVMVIIFVAFIIVFIIVFAIMMVAMTFLGNPLWVGCQKFFNRSLETDGDLNHLVSGFTKNYKNTVKVMFFTDLYTILWSLLFIIPGIIKSYEYLMIPYILGDNPDISKEEAFALSKKMMMGHKWEAFVLGLSFIGWELLSVLTFGILHIFYVTPYRYYTYAALYRKLSGKDEAIEVQA